MSEQGLFPLKLYINVNLNILNIMIGKLLRWLGFIKEPTPKLHLTKFTEPTYPPELSDVFPENRTETHTDTCLWQRYGTDKKP